MSSTCTESGAKHDQHIRACSIVDVPRATGSRPPEMVICVVRVRVRCEGGARVGSGGGSATGCLGGLDNELGREGQMMAYGNKEYIDVSRYRAYVRPSWPFAGQSHTVYVSSFQLAVIREYDMFS